MLIFRKASIAQTEEFEVRKATKEDIKAATAVFWENSIENPANKEKTMIIRGAAGKKCPLGGRAKVDDSIYFVETGGDMIVTHRAIISNVIESEKMTPDESVEFIKKYEKELNLSKAQYDRWAGKKFLAVYEISNLEEIEPFKYDREKNMDDWIITDDINKIKQ